MTRLARLAAIMFVLLFIATAVASLVLANLVGIETRSSLSLLIATGFFVIVGALILARRPDNSMGWIFCAIGLVWSVGALAVEYSVYATVSALGAPAGWVGAWFGEWNWIVFWFLTLVVTPSVFPTGKPLSGRWRRFLIIAVSAASIMTVLVALDPALEIEGTDRTLRNPIGIEGATWLEPDDEDSPASSVLFPLMFLSAGAAGVSVVLRFRRSRGDERLQLKWFAFAAVLLVLGFFALAFTTGEGTITDLYGVFVAFVPVSAGIAILKYRLYDIDVIINRTLVYGALTAILLLSYFAIVVALSRVLDPVTRDSDIAVAASTLAVAALFRPLRARIQGLIDRRFYRARYDARRALEGFGARLRDEIEVDVVRLNVLGVVGETLQPAHASLWVKRSP